MTETSDMNLRCFLALPFSAEFANVRRVVKEAAIAAGFEPISLDDRPAKVGSLEHMLFAELARTDCIVADVSTGNTNVFFEIGQAFAMAKGIVLLADESARPGLPSDVQNLNVVSYRQSSAGMLNLKRRLHKELRRLRHGAHRGPSLFRSRGSMPFFVDLDRLEHEDVENLCRELLLQMGYRRVEWQKNSREFDIVAELPKKDPDGFEYRELWLVSLGQNSPIDITLDLALHDPEIFDASFTAREFDRRTPAVRAGRRRFLNASFCNARRKIISWGSKNAVRTHQKENAQTPSPLSCSCAHMGSRLRDKSDPPVSAAWI